MSGFRVRRARNGSAPESRAILKSRNRLLSFLFANEPPEVTSAGVRHRNEREGLSKSKDMARIAWTLAGPSVSFEKFECQAARSAGGATGGNSG